MNGNKNPYPEFLIDEASGIRVPCEKYQIWKEGYKAGKEDRRLIKKVMKSEKGMVLVFDKAGEQMPKYQGQYEEARERVLRDAPLDAVFSRISNKIEAIPREEW